jgi:hypothetical protein
MAVIAVMLEQIWGGWRFETNLGKKKLVRLSQKINWAW